MISRLTVATAELFGVAVGAVVVVECRISLDASRLSPTRRPGGPG